MLIIFDLDGTLVDCKDLHFEAFNRALIQLGFRAIRRDEHLAKYDGLPTKKKMDLLNIPYVQRDALWRIKQGSTLAVISETIKPNLRISDVLRKLQNDGHQLVCASNSVRATMEFMLVQSGLRDFFAATYSNEDVKTPKPHPEIFMRAMLDFGVSPKETLIVEDSHIGRRAAQESGAYLCGVRDSSEVTYENIVRAMPKDATVKPKWQGKNLNVLIPMAGAGSRFEQVGYSFPKPLIDVGGKPMIQMVVENLNIDAHHIFIVQKSHYEKYSLQYLLNLIAPGCDIVQVEGITEGAACTTLLAKEFINNENPLLISNCDQYVEWDSNEFLYSSSDAAINGSILTFEATHPKWSYVKTDENGWVTEVAEKVVISNQANVGIYYWQRGSDYVKYAEQMISADRRVRNEFYVAPVYSEAIADGKKIKTFNVSRMLGCGTPEDLQEFLKEYNK